MTPEGKIKKEVDRTLERVRAHRLEEPFIWWFKPVQSGFGKRALDYVGCLCGRFFSVETKAPGEQLTQFQKLTAIEMLRCGGAVWIISELETVVAFEDWLLEQMK